MARPRSGMRRAAAIAIQPLVEGNTKPGTPLARTCAVASSRSSVRRYRLSLNSLTCRRFVSQCADLARDRDQRESMAHRDHRRVQREDAAVGVEAIELVEIEPCRHRVAAAAARAAATLAVGVRAARPALAARALADLAVGVRAARPA